MCGESAEETGSLHLRLIRRCEGGTSGSVARPDGSQDRFDGWLGLLAVLERRLPAPTVPGAGGVRDSPAREPVLSRRLARLSGREREVLELLAEGCRAAAVAERLVMPVATVRGQIRDILATLEVGSQLEAVALLHRQVGS